jgi:hypothetical protein
MTRATRQAVRLGRRTRDLIHTAPKYPLSMFPHYTRATEGPPPPRRGRKVEMGGGAGPPGRAFVVIVVYVVIAYYFRTTDLERAPQRRLDGREPRTGTAPSPARMAVYLAVK